MKRCVGNISFLIAIIMAWSSAAFAQSRVLMVSAERSEIFQTGGLAHATAGLAEGLIHEGIPTDVLMPYYLEMKTPPLEDLHQEFTVELDWRDGKPHKKSVFSLLHSTDHENPTLFLKHESPLESNYFNNISNGSKKKSYAPEAFIGESFGAFCKAAADYILSNHYDVVILNDWTTGLIATHLKAAQEKGLKIPKIIYAIHNLAYQGIYPMSLADFLGLSLRDRHMHGYEYWGQMSFMKAGLMYSDMIYTVSPQYAQEISTHRFGAGFDGVIRERMLSNKVAGILNGIDNEAWDPSRSQPGLEWTFDSSDLSGKSFGKAVLQEKLNFKVDPKVPLFILTSRMVEQKGFEYLLGAIEKAAENLSAQWLIMGDGDDKYTDQARELERRFPEKIRYKSFSGDMEKMATRYADFFVNGAWFEPSGLNQLFALKNGTLPVVSKAGGLLNSVKQDQTGILFDIIPGAADEPYSREATQASAYKAFQYALSVYADSGKLQRMRKQGMMEDNSWAGRIQHNFKALFEYVLEEGQKTMPFNEWKNQSRGSPSCSQLLAN